MPLPPILVRDKAMNGGNGPMTAAEDCYVSMYWTCHVCGQTFPPQVCTRISREFIKPDGTSGWRVIARECLHHRKPRGKRITDRERAEADEARTRG